LYQEKSGSPLGILAAAAFAYHKIGHRQIRLWKLIYSPLRFVAIDKKENDSKKNFRREQKPQFSRSEFQIKKERGS
jgi:hypothetical protein